MPHQEETWHKRGHHGGTKRTQQNVPQSADQSNNEEWKRDFIPSAQRKPNVSFRDQLTAIPNGIANQVPKRSSRKVANLDTNTVIGNSGLPARNTRAKFAVAAAALAAGVSSNQVNIHQ